jgi:D-alanyl-D-alanine carboxypeptidase
VPTRAIPAVKPGNAAVRRAAEGTPIVRGRGEDGDLVVAVRMPGSNAVVALSQQVSDVNATADTVERRILIAAALALAVGWGGIVYAANNSVQGAKKEEGGFDGDAPTAILIEANSGSVLFEKNADELRAPSSMMKLMTAETVFHAIKQGEVKLTDEYRISENAWRKGGAPSGGSTMFAAIHSKISVDDLLHGAIIHSGNDACIALAEGIAGNERIFADMMTKRARELGLTQSTFSVMISRTCVSFDDLPRKATFLA